MPESKETVTVEKALALGLEHYEAKRLPEAENVYTQILRKYPNQHVALHMLGLIAYQVNKHDVAIELITKALKISSNYVDAHNNLGIVLQSSGRQKEAIASFNKALAINPEFPAAHNNLGITNYQLGDVNAAIERYRIAIRIHSSYFDAHLNLGVALAHIGRLEEAVVSYKNALEIRTDHPECYNNLGNTFRALGRFEDSVECYQRAVELKPDYSEAHNNLGNILRDDNRRHEAISSYRNALLFDPGFEMAQHNIGTTLQELGRMEEAIGALEKIDTDLSRPALLECIYACKNTSRFFLELNRISKQDKKNVGVAAISAFGSHQFGQPDPYPFCPNSMDFISAENLIGKNLIDQEFLITLRQALFDSNLGGGNQSLLHSGFQSAGTLFLEPYGILEELQTILKTEIKNYFLNLESRNYPYIKLRPENYILRGWYIVMERGGFLKPHNHPSGWLSGVLYIKIPEKRNEEANIEFGLHGKDLPILNLEYPKMIYPVVEGDLIMFPSSLFHRTLPFQNGDERICVAFDLMPSEPDKLNNTFKRQVVGE